MSSFCDNFPASASMHSGHLGLVETVVAVHTMTHHFYKRFTALLILMIMVCLGAVLPQMVEVHSTFRP